MANNISDDYLIGFIEGEGCFYVGVVPATTTRYKWQIIYFFKVSQNPSGKVVLDTLKKRLDCGYIKPNDREGASDKSLAFVVRDLNDLQKKVIPFLEGKLIIKRSDFDKFKKIVDSIAQKRHQTSQGFKEMVDLIYTLPHIKRKFPKEMILQKILTDYTPKSDITSDKI